MADDGMLLNLAAPSGDAWAPKAQFKGGRWKDRLTAKKSAEYGAQKRKERAEASTGANTEDLGPVRPRRQIAAEPDTAEDQAPKRRKVDFTPRPTPRPQHSTDNRQLHSTGQSRPTKPSQSAPREVISSLFTYNPTTTSKPEPTVEEPETPLAPSNAPLTAEEQTFTNLGLSLPLTQHLLTKLTLTAPTSIQRRAIPAILSSSSDAFIQAETGSGKTLAYLLPLVQRLTDLSVAYKASTGQKLGRDSGLFAIILAPTRELCRQIATVLEALLGCARWVVSGTVTGGEKKKSEKARLRKGINILVATPGRLADHLSNTEVLDVSRVRWLVLDEGDRLMELGFEADIQKLVGTLNLRMRKEGGEAVVSVLPDRRCTVMCSATLKMDVQRLGEISLKDATHIAGESGDVVANGQAGKEEFQAPSQLKQSYAVVPAKQRLVTLVAVLRRAFARKGATMKTIVFMACADSVDFHYMLLTHEPPKAEEADSSTEKNEDNTTMPGKTAKGTIAQGTMLSETNTSAPSPAISNSDSSITVHRLHGSLPQHVRTSTLSTFAHSTTPSILLCTDVASRGLDLPNIDYVIEYDPAFSRDEHLHRIGRTARAGKAGRALVFLTPGCEEGYVDVLKSGRREGTQSVGRHESEELLRKGFGPTTGVVQQGDRRWEGAATEWQLEVERWVLEDTKMLEMARRAYQSHIRAYATHVAAEREWFDIKQLHLGHLAKAFGLRDRPGSIKVPGLRQGKDAVKRSRDKAGAGGKKAKDEDGEAEAVSDAAEARRKMLKMSRSMGGASEFNLG